MIMFKKLRWKNFLSTGNYFTELDLHSNPTTLVVGANGSGKSTMLDALCFSLFGKPFRNVNKPQLVNSINSRDAVVEIEFETNSRDYRIVRGLKPNVFEIYCNGTLVTQSAAVKDYQEHLEKFILKLNYKSFTQIVILGSASFTPFMQLSAADRRSIIEDLLDIQIFSRMNGILKEKYALLKENLSMGKHKQELIAEKIEMQEKYITNITKDKADAIQLKRDNIAAELLKIQANTEKSDALTREIEVLRDSIQDGTIVTKKSEKYYSLQEDLKKALTKANKDIKFYEENDDCPTCKQSLPNNFKNEMVDKRKDKIEQIRQGLRDIESKQNEVSLRQDEITKVMANITSKMKDSQVYTSAITASLKYIDSINIEINSLSKDTTNLEEENEKLGKMKAEKLTQEVILRELSDERSYYDVATLLLKDTGIKTKIIKQYIPVINKQVNKYLSAMDFFVNFNLDESFKETIKSRHRDDFSYASFSEGEKQRIDMALMLTWRAIAKMKNSSNTNLLILDEVFDSSLDANGTEDLMKILNILEHTNLFVISHKGDILQDKFRNVMRFEKVNNFSRIVK
jgi:DNA repair exonuclease SbcCD ATPase subunit